MLLLFHRREEIELDLARRVIFLGSGKILKNSRRTRSSHTYFLS